jgi:hypothetical protein
MAINNKSADIQYYLNTLIYIIILKAIGILSVLLFLFKIGSYISYIVLTYQIVLVVIICYVLYKIVTFNKKLKKQREEEMKAPAILHNCPNFYTREVNDDDEIVCKSSFTTANGKYTYTFLNDIDEQMAEQNISTMTYDAGTMETLCLNYKEDKHGNYPWIEYKAKCDRL